MFKNLMKKILKNKRHPELVWLLLPKFQFRAKCTMCAEPQGCGINTPHPTLTSHKTFTGCFARQSRKGRVESGFTLAEVLITLGIIGVVAALTIPTLIQNEQEKSTVVALKKAYSTFANAFNLATQENGTPDTWTLSGSMYSSADAIMIMNYISPYLRIIKNCGNGTGCFSSTPVYRVYNLPNKLYAVDSIDTTNYISKAQLADGSLIWIFSYGAKYSRGNSLALQNVYGEFFVDINGLKKPNSLGRDVFPFYITKYGIMPMGSKLENSSSFSFDNNCKMNSSDSLDGYGCTAWVLYNENMDYLHCDDLSWDGKHTCN